MKKNILLVLIMLYSFLGIMGAEKKYPVNEIPQELLENAKVVIRNRKAHFKIESSGDGKMEVTEVYTILNNAGLDYSYFIEGYSKYLKIRNVKGIFYDKDGNVLKKLKKDELLDIPAISGYSLYEDNRALIYKPDIETYPFTAEYNYSIDFDGLFSYPSWEIYPDYNVAVQNSEFVVTLPEGMKLREYYQNLEQKPYIKDNNSEKVYTWLVNNMPAIEYEPYSESISNWGPTLFLAPVNFKIGGYNGKMETWAQFGNWIAELNEGRNNLPEETKIKIGELVKGAGSDREKIEILYKYLQDKTRYVNVSVGMGGWQPFESETVDRLSYGDCKALSFYMKSLLEIAGVKSYYTLVKAGANVEKILSDFPMNQFNHVILCIPVQEDTVWLECTSQIMPTGFIGDFTDDRDVLIIDGENSKLVRTPRYNIDDNIQARKIEFVLNENGEGDAKVFTRYHGLACDDLIHRIDLPIEDNKKWLYKNINIKDFVIEGFNYTIDKKEIPELCETMELKVKNYASAMGDRLIVPVNLMNRIDYVPKRLEERKTKIEIRRSRCKIDSIHYTLPENYQIENIPEKETIRTKYGEYVAECYMLGREVLYVRKFDFYKGVYSPDEYDDFRSFLKKISKADKSKFVLKKI